MKKVLLLLLVLVLLSAAVLGGLSLLEQSGFWDTLAQNIGEYVGQAVSPAPEPPPADDGTNGEIPDEPYDEGKGQLDVDEVLQARLQQAVSKRQIEVNIADLGYDAVSLKEQITRFFFTHPELFYVDQKYEYYKEKNGTVVKTVKLSYLYSAQESARMTAEYESALESITSGIPTGASDFDKVLYLHDYLVQHYEYDHEGAKDTPVRDAYRFFQTGRGVCQAYMLAMIALCERVGIPSLPVTSDEMEHAWNLVKLDGEWYHMDVTWDDAGGEESAVYPSFVSYRYFLLSGEALYNGGRRVTWSASEQATSKLYDDAIWRDTTTNILKKEKNYYCALFDGAEKTTKIYGGSPTRMLAVLTLENVIWYSDATHYYRTSFAGLALWGDGILISTGTAFFLYDVQSGGIFRLADLKKELGDKQIFGICGVDEEGTVRYVVARDYHGEYEVVSRKFPLR